MDPLAEGRHVRVTARRHQLGDRTFGTGQAGGREVAAVDDWVVRPSGLIGVGLDVEYELDCIIDPGHADVDRHVAEAIEEGPRARRRHPLNGELPTASSLRSVGERGNDLEPLAQIGDRRAVAVANPLFQSERA